MKILPFALFLALSATAGSLDGLLLDPPRPSRVPGKPLFAVPKPKGIELRTVNDITNNIWRATNWFDFVGKTTSAHGPEGTMLVSGILDDGRYPKWITYAIRNYPSKLADNERIGPVRVKHTRETITYRTVMAGPKTVWILDYGVPCNQVVYIVPPPRRGR